MSADPRDQPHHGNVLEDALIDGLSKIDPLFSAHQDFDYDAVEIALGCAPEQLDEVTCSRLADALAVLLRWITNTKIQPGAEREIGLRALSAAWVVRPDLLDSVSQCELGRKLGHVHKMELSKHCAEFSRVFPVKNRAQSHGHAPAARPETEVADG